MQRIAFQLLLKKGAEEAYDRAHGHVWPELLAELSANGVREYSIFRRDSQIFLYMLVPDFKALVAALAESEVDRRWQRMMAPFMETAPSLREGETFAMMEEVFYMQGDAGGSSSARQSVGDDEQAG